MGVGVCYVGESVLENGIICYEILSYILVDFMLVYLVMNNLDL